VATRHLQVGARRRTTQADLSVSAPALILVVAERTITNRRSAPMVQVIIAGVFGFLSLF
jgi:hypothetical protein